MLATIGAHSPVPPERRHTLLGPFLVKGHRLSMIDTTVLQHRHFQRGCRAGVTTAALAKTNDGRERSKL